MDQKMAGNSNYENSDKMRKLLAGNTTRDIVDDNWNKRVDEWEIKTVG